MDISWVKKDAWCPILKAKYCSEATMAGRSQLKEVKCYGNQWPVRQAGGRQQSDASGRDILNSNLLTIGQSLRFNIDKRECVIDPFQLTIVDMTSDWLFYVLAYWVFYFHGAFSSSYVIFHVQLTSCLSSDFFWSKWFWATNSPLASQINWSNEKNN